MLRCLDQRATRRLDPVAMAGLATGLGADVPVCLAGLASHMTGIGNILHPVNPPPRGHIVLAWPRVMLSHPKVFHAFAESAGSFTAGASIRQVWQRSRLPGPEMILPRRHSVSAQKSRW